MRRLIACSMLSFLAAAAPADLKPIPFDPAQCAKDVAPFLDEQTVAVLRLDLTRVDVRATFGRLATLARTTGDHDAEELAGAGQMIEQLAARMRQAGGRVLYLVVSLADIPPEPMLVIVPLAKGADARAIQGILYSGRPDGPTSRPVDPKRPGRPRTQVHVLGRSVVRCNWPVWQRVRQMKPHARPELEKAFAAAGEAACHAILLPTPDNRRVIDEMLPTLPGDLGGGSTRPITRGLLWAVLAADGPPKMKMKLLIQSPDAAAAADLAKALARIYAATAKLLTPGKKLTNLQDLLGVLTPTVRKDRLVIDLSHAKLEKLLSGPVTELLKRPAKPDNPRKPAPMSK